MSVPLDKVELSELVGINSNMMLMERIDHFDYLECSMCCILQLILLSRDKMNVWINLFKNIYNKCYMQSIWCCHWFKRNWHCNGIVKVSHKVISIIGMCFIILLMANIALIIGSTFSYCLSLIKFYCKRSNKACKLLSCYQNA